MELSHATKAISGILLITVPTIQFGGVFLLRMLTTSDSGYVGNSLRPNLFRAGHAHAGVLVLLSLVCEIYADAVTLPRALMWFARLGSPVAAILMPLGFFLSVVSPRAAKPNRLITLVYLGALFLAAAMLALGVGLIRSA
jgi:hypothetical protein